MMPYRVGRACPVVAFPAPHPLDPEQTARGLYLRQVALFVFALAVLSINPAQAQQVDIAAGGGTLLSLAQPNDSATVQSPAEKNGTYVNLSADYVRADRHLGLEFETAWRYHQANYPFNGERYRPFLSDLNVIYQPRLPRRKFGADLMAGLGIASTRFTGLTLNPCSDPAVGCVNYTGTNHFMEDLGVGLRYYFFRRFFVRPEIHYYHIQNNEEFNSNNVFRASVSIGFTIHRNTK